MTRIPVDDADDPRLAAYRDLNRHNPTRWAGHFIAEGDKVVERLIASRYEVESLLLEPALVERFEPLAPRQTPVYVGSRRVLESIIGFNFHRGVLACGRRLPPLSLDDLFSGHGRNRPFAPAASTLVVCPDIKDPTNLGSILRTSAALGVEGVILGPHCADFLSRRVVRVSMAAALQLPIVVEADIAACLRRLHDEFGYESVAAVADADAPSLAKSARSAKMAIVFGGEAHGLPVEMLAACDHRATIPMQLGIDSLNVAVAAAVFLFHFCQREST